MLKDVEQVVSYLHEKRWISPDAHPLVQPLTGGVSSLVWKIESGDERWVLKQALEKLNVAVEWVSDQERITHEQRVMQAVCQFVPPFSVPRVLFSDETRHIYVMECAPETALTWKQRLLGGELDMPTARNAGAWLRVFHEGSAGMSVERRRGLDGFRYFEQLRLDPFHRYVMEKYPALRTTIQSLIEQLKQPICMVHGDFSPKNILVDGNANVIVLDFEVAHWGNPVFDAAFCLTHLILKALIFGPFERYDHLIGQFMAGYGELPAGICAHIGLLLLARVDGKSPADYIRTEPQRQRIRQIAMRWIATAEDAGKSGEGGNVLRLLRQEKARTNG